MKIYRISFLLRSPSVGWDYKDKYHRNLPEALVEAVKNALAPVMPVYQSKGSVQHHFYVVTDYSAEQYKTMAGDLLTTLIPDENLRKMIIVSVTEPDGNELDSLRQKVEPQENLQFWETAEKNPPEKKEKVEEKHNNVSFSAAMEKAADHMEPADQPQEPEAPEEPVPLSAQAQKIQQLRQGLLGKVRGQRHAVDEVVRSIFESEMFSALNPERKGPLATFLFTGPSGVGKTYLASLCGKMLNRKMLIVDMSEYSDNLANLKFNGEHRQPAVVTGFARENPKGIIVFDEVEKAHINTIHLFLQILDGARLMDHEIGQEVSFRDNIIIMTTNAGKALY